MKIIYNKYIKTISPTLGMVFILSMACAILYKFVLIKIPAPYDWMIDGGEFTYNILMAILTGCVIYFFTVHIVQEKRKVDIEPYLTIRIANIIFYYDKMLLLHLEEERNHKFPNHIISDRDWQSYLSKTSVKAGDWYDLIRQHNEFIKEEINSIMNYVSIHPNICDFMTGFQCQLLLHACYSFRFPTDQIGSWPDFFEESVLRSYIQWMNSLISSSIKDDYFNKYTQSKYKNSRI